MVVIGPTPRVFKARSPQSPRSTWIATQTTFRFALVPSRNVGLVANQSTRMPGLIVGITLSCLQPHCIEQQSQIIIAFCFGETLVDIGQMQLNQSLSREVLSEEAF